MAQKWYEVFGIEYKVVIPRVLVHFHLLSQYMHSVRFSQPINKILQLILN